MFPDYNADQSAATQGLQEQQQPAPPAMPAQAALLAALQAQQQGFPQGQPAPNTPPVPGQPISGPAQMPAAAQTTTSDMETALQGVRAKAEDLMRKQQQAAEQGTSAHQFLTQMLSTDALGRYLPKPSAKQMLSDALANFGMARLTGGNFTPIQTKRYEEAFKRHDADVQNAQLMLQSAHQDQLSYANELNHWLNVEKLGEKAKNDQAARDAQNAAIEQRRQAANMTNGAKAAYLDLSRQKMDKQSPEWEARARQFNSLADQLDSGGSNQWTMAGKIVDSMVESGDLANEPDAKLGEMKKVLETFRDASKYKPTPGQSLIGRIMQDADGGIFMATGNKTTGEGAVKRIDTADLGDISFNKLSAPAKTAIGQIKSAESLGTDLMPILAKYKDVGKGSIFDAIGAGAKERLAWQRYVHGLGNGTVQIGDSPNTGSGDLDKIIQLGSMMKIVGSQPYLRGIRNGTYIQGIQKHLIDPEIQTPSEMWKRLTTVMPQWSRMKEEILDNELHPVSSTRSAAKASTPSRTPATPAGAKQTGGPGNIVTDPGKINW